MKRHKIITGVVGAVVLLTIFGALLGEDPDTEGTVTEVAAEPKAAAVTEEQEAPAKTETPTEKEPEEKTAPSNEFGTYGPAQEKFVAAALTARDKYENADNELQEGAALNERNTAMCDMIGDGRVQGWQGKVITLDSNGDGYGVIELEIADDIKVATWNNAFSDIMDETLIKPGPLYDSIIKLSEGDVVQFSGQFLDGSDTCVNDSALTLNGSTTSPDFIFRFSDVKKLN